MGMAVRVFQKDVVRVIERSQGQGLTHVFSMFSVSRSQTGQRCRIWIWG